MVDIHCHILPGMDDGAASWDTALEMCRRAAADGIHHIVATPHANDEFAYDRERAVATLERLQTMAGGAVKFSLGCDFHLSYDNVRAALTEPEQFAIAGGSYLLVELSDFGTASAAHRALAKLREAGLKPIITHPERNLALAREPRAVLRMVEEGCAVQVTASALTGYWGPGVQEAAHWLLDHDAVHVLASDAHGAEKRPPVLSAGRDAAAQIVGGDVARALVDDNPSAIVAGQPLPYFPKPAKS